VSKELSCRQTGAGMQERPANATGAFRVAVRTTGAKASIPGPEWNQRLELEEDVTRFSGALDASRDFRYSAMRNRKGGG
jgi:hypothetical protein